MRTPCLAAALEELGKAGIRHPEIANGGKHLQLRWAPPSEQRRTYRLPSSPSDWRGPPKTPAPPRRPPRPPRKRAKPPPPGAGPPPPHPGVIPGRGPRRPAPPP